jgi:hypothetical protein
MRVTVTLLPTSSVTASSTVYWPSVVMPCGEYGEAAAGRAAHLGGAELRAATTLAASAGGVNVTLGADCVNAGGVATAVSPVDLSTVNDLVADTALDSLPAASAARRQRVRPAETESTGTS